MRDTEIATERGDRGEIQRLRQKQERYRDYDGKRRDTEITTNGGEIQRLRQKQERHRDYDREERYRDYDRQRRDTEITTER